MAGNIVSVRRDSARTTRIKLKRRGPRVPKLCRARKRTSLVHGQRPRICLNMTIDPAIRPVRVFLAFVISCLEEFRSRGRTPRAKEQCSSSNNWKRDLRTKGVAGVARLGNKRGVEIVRTLEIAQEATTSRVIEVLFL